MANYPIPSWLGPQAALGWGALAGEAARARATQEIERDRLAQQSAQFAIESQQRAQQLNEEMKARQDALNYQHLLQSQKIAIDQAYKQQMLGLDEQRIDLAQKNFESKTADAARKFAATQAFQKAMLPPEQGGEGLDATRAALKYLAPYMTADSVSRTASSSSPFKITPPSPLPGHPGKESVQTGPHRFQIIDAPPDSTAAPVTQSVTNSAGSYLGDRVIFPDTGKVVWKPHTQSKGSGTDLESLVRARLQAQTATSYKTKDDVVSAYKNGKLTREQAAKLLNEQFGVPLK